MAIKEFLFSYLNKLLPFFGQSVDILMFNFMLINNNKKMIGVTIKSTLQNVKKCRLKYALSTKLFNVCRLSRGSCPCYSKANSSIDVSSVCPRQEPLTCYIHVYLHINVSNIFEIK